MLKVEISRIGDTWEWELQNSFKAIYDEVGKSSLPRRDSRLELIEYVLDAAYAL